MKNNFKKFVPHLSYLLKFLDFFNSLFTSLKLNDKSKIYAELIYNTI